MGDTRENNRCVWLALCLALGLLLGLLVAGGEAQTRKPTPVATRANHVRICEVQGNLAASIARSRDVGVPLSTTLHVGVQDETPAHLRAWMDHIMIAIYQAPTMTPDAARHAVEVQCFTALGYAQR